MALKRTDQHSFTNDLMDNPLVVLGVIVAGDEHCLGLLSQLESCAANYPKISFFTLDAGSSPHLAAQLNLTNVPTIYAWRNGALLWAKIGLPPKGVLEQELDHWLASETAPPSRTDDP